MEAAAFTAAAGASAQARSEEREEDEETDEEEDEWEGEEEEEEEEESEEESEEGNPQEVVATPHAVPVVSIELAPECAAGAAATSPNPAATSSASTPAPAPASGSATPHPRVSALRASVTPVMVVDSPRALAALLSDRHATLAEEQERRLASLEARVKMSEEQATRAEVRALELSAELRSATNAREAVGRLAEVAIGRAEASETVADSLQAEVATLAAAAREVARYERDQAQVRHDGSRVDTRLESVTAYHVDAPPDDATRLVLVRLVLVCRRHVTIGIWPRRRQRNGSSTSRAS